MALGKVCSQEWTSKDTGYDEIILCAQNKDIILSLIDIAIGKTCVITKRDIEYWL